MGGHNGVLVAYGIVVNYENWTRFKVAWNKKAHLEHKQAEPSNSTLGAAAEQETESLSASSAADSEDEEQELHFQLDEYIGVDISEWVRTNKHSNKQRPYPEEVFLYLQQPSTDTRCSRSGIYTSPPVWLADKVEDRLFAALSEEHLGPFARVRDILKELDVKNTEGWYVLMTASD